MKNKIISSLLALMILAQLVVPAHAVAVSGGTGESSAILNQEQTNFNVTVPTSLPVAVDSVGVVTTASDVEIINNSYGPISISDIRVDVLNGWSLVDFDKDMSTSTVGLKEFGFSIQDDKVQPDGGIVLTPSSWESVPGDGSIYFNYDAKVSPQKTALSDVNIANVVFILGWDTDGETGPEETSKYTLATDADFIKIEDYFRYIGTDEYVEIPHVIQGENVTSYSKMFAGTSVKGVKSTSTAIITMDYMFSGSTADTLDLSDLNTVGVKYMDGMFMDSLATSLVFGSSFDTSNVTTMYLMFRNSQATALDLSSFDTSNVAGMGSMFRDSQALTIDLSSFDTSAVTTMYEMFRGSQATALDLSSFDTSQVTNMHYMFRDSQALTIDLSSFDTSAVTTMYEMFRGSRALTLDLSSFDTSKLDSMQSMFNGSQATSIILSSFDTSNVTTMQYMFKDSKVTTLDLSSFDTSKVAIISEMFDGAQVTTGYARTQADADKFNASSNKPAGLTFVAYILATDADFTISGLEDGVYDEIHYIGTAEYVEIPHVIQGVAITSYQYMFNGSNVKGVKATNKNITTMQDMFANTTSDSLDLTEFDMANASTTDMFNSSRLTKVYVKTQADADKLNSSIGKPAGLTAIVK